jgi:hypothetical protein
MYLNRSALSDKRILTRSAPALEFWPFEGPPTWSRDMEKKKIHEVSQAI